MKIKFYGTFGELRDWLVAHGIVGVWQPEPNGCHMLRRNDGSNLHWASGSKSLWCDGKAAPAEQLRAYVERVLCGDQGCVKIEESIHARRLTSDRG